MIWGHKALARKMNGSYYYYLYNGHGDVVKVVDENGNIVNSYTYDEWGNLLYKTEQVANPIRYAGEYYDEETGLYYLRARYYDPTTGRFISRDADQGVLTNPLSLNDYLYVLGNPLAYVDPMGYSWLTVGLTVAALGASVLAVACTGGAAAVILPGVATGLRLAAFGSAGYDAFVKERTPESKVGFVLSATGFGAFKVLPKISKLATPTKHLIEHTLGKLEYALAVNEGAHLIDKKYHSQPAAPAPTKKAPPTTVTPEPPGTSEPGGTDDPLWVFTSADYRMIGNRAAMWSRQIAGYLGKSVAWDPETKRVSIGGVWFNPLLIEGGKSYLSIREVFEYFGYTVVWNAGVIKIY